MKSTVERLYLYLTNDCNKKKLSTEIDDRTKEIAISFTVDYDIGDPFKFLLFSCTE